MRVVTRNGRRWRMTRTHSTVASNSQEKTASTISLVLLGRMRLRPRYDRRPKSGWTPSLVPVPGKLRVRSAPCVVLEPRTRH